MLDSTPSRTAAWVAAARGLGTLLPPEARLALDPYGVAFSSQRMSDVVQAARLPGGWARLPGLADFVLYMQVRTRVLDDAVRAFVANGGRQLVLLGAGYDCRALRLPELAAARVFEVDHPATQGHKRSVLTSLGRSSGSHYLRWHFERQPMAELPAALVEAGHDPSAPTLTLWEGVTMYLTEPAIDATVRAVADYSGPGSQLALTYLHADRLRRPSLVTRAVRAVVAGAGEPWTWGWDPSELPAWMLRRGLTVLRDESLGAAGARLLPPSFARRLQDPTRRVAVVARESVAVARL